MSTVREFLADLAKRDIKLWVDGEQLRCNAPKGTLTRPLLQKISTRKADILSFLRRTEQEADRPPIQPVLRNQNIPLSFAQQRLWFLDHLEGTKASYNLSGGVQLSGALNVNALSESLNVLAQRHDVLRTTFLTQAGADGEPVQRIAPAARVELPLIDLQASDDMEAEVRKYATQEAQQTFDLAAGPLWRAVLLRLGPAEHVLLFTMHHIISDGWSLGILVREVSSLYEAFSQGKPSALPALAVQYADFAVWQRQWLQGKILAEQLGYWQQQLTAAPPLLPLPTDHPRPPVQSFRGASHSFTLPKELSSQLQALSLKSDATLFMTLLSTFKVLLMRYAGQQDILVGTPIANRHLKEIEPLIGFFVNTLVLRSDLSGNPTFLELLGRVRQTALDAYKHQDLPFERLVEALQLERNLSHTPLFTVMFVLQNAPIDEMPLAGLTLTPLQVPRATAKFDLTLSMEEKEGELIGEWEYSTDLFEHETIRRMSRNFQTLLAGIVANPTQPIGELPLLREAERQQLLVEWNDTQADYPYDKCIHQLFEEQVERTPDATAVVFGDKELSYRELNAKANQLAHHLIRQGVGPEVLVGICLERSIDLMVGLLGVLKAGGAYVPLDPSLPDERLAFMLSDAQVKVLLTHSKWLAKWESVESIGMENLGKLLSLMPDVNPKRDIRPDNLAYVIYTSGSTGRPKGTLIVHQGVTNYLFWCTRAYSVAEGNGAPVNSSIGFDATITSLFSPLLVGKKVLMLPVETEIETLSSTLRQKNNFSLIKITPSHLELLSHYFSEQLIQATRSFIIGGEALLSKHLAFWRTHAPDTILVNEYGPTETVVGCCVYEVRPEHPTESLSGSVPIGRPIANTQLYVLDRYLQPVPIGVPGELYIGGAGVARGYLNRPQLTREKFVPNPFGGGRLYKTGDLCRSLPDGNLLFLGRIDHQVKIRGFRIELGEIEAVLSQHKAVQEVVVIVREEETGKRLVAYVVCQPPVSSSILRAYLSETLPDYMVPAAFVQLDALPLTPNGKINRRVLPAPTRQSQLETTYVEPSTDTERQIVAVWEELLQVEQVGIHDNFFELGGHSLLMVRLHHRLQGMYEQPLTITDLFKYPTVHSLARYVSQPKHMRLTRKIKSDQVAESPTASRRTRKTTAKERRKLRQTHRKRR